MATTDYILTINAGSSSIKVNLFQKESLEEIDSLIINGINYGELKFYQQGKEIYSDFVGTDLLNVIQQIVLWLKPNWDKLAVIVHRFIFGGQHYHEPTICDKKLIDYLKKNISLDPEHTPMALKILEILQSSFPNVSQVACFDSGYFKDLPRLAQIIPLPRKYQDAGLRRYGYHGLAYQSVAKQLFNINPATTNQKNIFAHLGSGVSMMAMDKGLPTEITMGLTPNSGLMMSTRSGSIDPEVPNLLYQSFGVDLARYGEIINKESGLLGISEYSSDMYQLIQKYDSDPNCQEAIDFFVYQIIKAFGSQLAVMGGVDNLVFSGGIGFNSFFIRNKIIKSLDWLGLELDPNANNNNQLVSSKNSTAGIYCLEADEAFIMSSQVKKYFKELNVIK